MSMNIQPVRGKIIRFTFTDGPMANKTVTHAFHVDGSVDFQSADGSGKKTHVDKYEAETISDDIIAVSYLGTAGYTLSVVLNFADHKLVAFSSNEKQLNLQHGTFEVAN